MYMIAKGILAYFKFSHKQKSCVFATEFIVTISITLFNHVGAMLKRACLVCF